MINNYDKLFGQSAVPPVVPSITAASAAVVGEEEFHSRLRRGTMRLGRVPVELVVVFALIDSPYREQNVVGEAQRRA
jgi:hypothetical protein